MSRHCSPIPLKLDLCGSSPGAKFFRCRYKRMGRGDDEAWPAWPSMPSPSWSISLLPWTNKGEARDNWACLARRYLDIKPKNESGAVWTVSQNRKKPPQNMAKRAMRAIIVVSILDLLCISHLDESYGMRKNIGPTEIGPGTEVCEKPVQMYWAISWVAELDFGAHIHGFQAAKLPSLLECLIHCSVVTKFELSKSSSFNDGTYRRHLELVCSWSRRTKLDWLGWNWAPWSLVAPHLQNWIMVSTPLILLSGGLWPQLPILGSHCLKILWHQVFLPLGKYQTIQTVTRPSSAKVGQGSLESQPQSTGLANFLKCGIAEVKSSVTRLKRRCASCHDVNDVNDVKQMFWDGFWKVWKSDRQPWSSRFSGEP